MYFTSTTRRAVTILITIAFSVFAMMGVALASTQEEESIEDALASLNVETIPDNVITSLARLWPDEIELKVLDAKELENRLQLALNLWEIMAPEWRATPASLMIQARLCRDTSLNLQQSPSTTSSTTPNQCGDNFRIQLRFQHAERLTTRLMERIAQAEELSEPSRTLTLETLTELRNRAENRLREMERIAPKTVDDALEPLGENQASLNQLRTRLEEQERLQEQTRQMNSSTTTTTATSTTTTNTTKGTMNSQQGNAK